MFQRAAGGPAPIVRFGALPPPLGAGAADEGARFTVLAAFAAAGDMLAAGFATIGLVQGGDPDGDRAEEGCETTAT